MVGDISFSLGAEKDGCILAYGETISNTGNGGDLVGSEYEPLFNFLTGLPINVNVSTSWETGKIAIPDFRGRTAVGADNMGGVSANVLTGAFDSSVVGNWGGSEDHKLTIGEIPSHTHTETRKGTHQVQAGSNKTSGNGNDATVPTGPAGNDEPHKDRKSVV